jgi:salicylate hydroxylase
MDSSQAFRIIIVGGGIAGTSAAIALRAPGRRITVVEQSRLHAEIGATISLQPNASRILEEEWRLEGLFSTARGMVDRGFRIYNVDGAKVSEIPLTTKSKYGADRIMYHRQDLHECLKKAATSTRRDGPPAEIRVSSRVVSCDCEAGVVVLENGEELEADLIVAADGIHSVLRRCVLDEDIDPIPTGLSLYRFMLPTEQLENEAPEFCANINPTEPYTSMLFAHDCRLISGPARDASVYSIVGLVPDERMNEDANDKQSWRSTGDLSRALQSFKDFPDWVRQPFKLANDLGLWQLRDLPPLRTWTKGRVILIGDAAHAMLPTQGQGASQAVEDAEALGAFFEGLREVPSLEQMHSLLQQVFTCRYERATLIQKYSRDAAKPPTEKGSNDVKM